VIVWTGWGVLTLLLTAAFSLGGTGIGVALGGPTDSANLGTAVGVALAGVAIWFVGRRLNRGVAGYDSRTGQPTVITNRHTFFWLPMQYWGPVAGVGAVAVAIVSLTAA
jgi:hypothetical protein